MEEKVIHAEAFGWEVVAKMSKDVADRLGVCSELSRKGIASLTKAISRPSRGIVGDDGVESRAVGDGIPVRGASVIGRLGRKGSTTRCSLVGA